jgi:23S rRNA pseudouridine1911/1915/1917 synthase
MMITNDSTVRPKILFEDTHCLVVEKPAGLSTGRDHRFEQSFIDIAQNYVTSEARQRGKKGYCVPIHFLDRPVSGVMLFAKSSKAATRFNEQFRGHHIEKHYLAVVEGAVEAGRHVLRDHLSKDPVKNLVKVVGKDHPDGKYCELSYELVERRNQLSLVKVFPVTGRSHQIRVQLSARGFAIVGDKKYGSRFGQELTPHAAILLHAYELSFIHPTLKERMTVQSAPPPYWSVFLQQAGFSSFQV